MLRVSQNQTNLKPQRASMNLQKYFNNNFNILNEPEPKPKMFSGH